MDPATVMLWIQVGSQLVQIGSVVYEKIRAVLVAEGITDEQLAELDALYDARIAKANAAAGNL